MRTRLKDVWPFGKPKTPGFGISSGFYLSVLAGTARLPSIVEVVEPKGTSGTVAGFGAPLIANTDKSKVVEPLERGAYAIASPDQKTVLRMLVLPKDEAGFDPEAFLRSPLSIGLSDELRNRARATWTLCQLTFEAHDPAVYPSLDFFLAIAKRLGELTEGVIADPLAQTYKLPSQLIAPDSAQPIDARNMISVGSDERYVFTLGMQKFSLPEFEMDEVEEPQTTLASEFLLGLCQSVLLGGPIQPGAQVGSKKAPIQVAEGGLNRARWEGIPCYELIPAKGLLSDALTAWSGERA